MSSPTLRQLAPTLAKSLDLEAPFAERRYEYLIARRDQLNDRIRTGSLALNGSSLVAILATLNGEGKAATWIGLTSDNAATAATFFVAGAVLAGAAIIVAGGQFAGEASDAFSRMLKTRMVAASHEAADNPTNRADALNALTDLHATPLVDFQFSRASIALQSCGAAAWLGGISVPLLTAFHVTERISPWLKSLGLFG